MDKALGAFTSKCTETNAPGIGGLHGKNRGWPSSNKPVKRLQIGFVPRSGRLLPTRTTIVAGLLFPTEKNGKKQMNQMKLRRWNEKMLVRWWHNPSHYYYLFNHCFSVYWFSMLFVMQGKEENSCAVPLQFPHHHHHLLRMNDTCIINQQNAHGSCIRKARSIIMPCSLLLYIYSEVMLHPTLRLVITPRTDAYKKMCHATCLVVVLITGDELSQMKIHEWNVHCLLI